MKWVFALTEASKPMYLELVRVAVLSARQNTQLSPYCLYDGAESSLTQWLREQGVEIIFCRSPFFEQLEALAHSENEPGYIQIGTGTFLRLELPRVAQELGWEDEFVLYTDCDVLFLSDPAKWLLPLKPRLFAAAPETFPNKPLHMNAGIMWMNLPKMMEHYDALNLFVKSNIKSVCDASWDQGALRVYFDPLHRAAWKLKVPDRIFYAVMSRLNLRSFAWDDLPLGLNWKPYWNSNKNASIVHFHILKPSHRLSLKNGELTPAMVELATPAFYEYSEQWDKWAAQI